jgi:hypothetical protein
MPTEPKRELDLAQRLNAAALELQKNPEGGSRFIQPWRIYANADHSSRLPNEAVSCSSGECGCGISPDVK